MSWSRFKHIALGVLSIVAGVAPVLAGANPKWAVLGTAGALATNLGTILGKGEPSK